MPLYDQFGYGQQQNGQGPPQSPQSMTMPLVGGQGQPPQVQGSPNFQIGNWGNIPQGFAGGLQQFLGQAGQGPFGSINPQLLQALSRSPFGGGQAGQMAARMPMLQNLQPFLGR